MLPSDLVYFIPFLSLAGKTAVLTFTVVFVCFILVCFCFLIRKEYSLLFFIMKIYIYIVKDPVLYYGSAR